ncbi:MAG TPA: Smr/MutS family protein [Burkholderiales bacterium]|nr:Smr/MutS family protein [Burkholderiales bacterium]
MQDDFRKAMAGVKPLKRAKRAVLRAPAPAPVPHQRQRDETAALAESLDSSFSVEDALETGEQLSYLREGMARETLRKLRRGHWAIQDGIDLHGLSREQAAVMVSEFLRQCLARGLRCVRIVHGKGLGILKAKLGKWLPRREEVLAYCQAPANDGGGGALLVLLKTKR